MNSSTHQSGHRHLVRARAPRGRRAGASRLEIVALAYALFGAWAALVGAQSGFAQQATPDQPQGPPQGESSFTWESRNETYNALPLAFDNLYGTLADIIRKGGAIPTKPWPLNEALLPFGKLERATLLRASKLFDGKYYPNNLDKLFCLLNPKHCKGENGNWQVHAGDEVILPDISIETYTELREYEKRSGDKIANIVVRDRKGCEKWDAACENTIKNLNSYKPNVLDDDFAGTILVPTQAYRAQIQITSFGPNETQPVPDSNLPNLGSAVALKPLLRHIVPEAQVNVQGVSEVCPAEPDRATPERVRELINLRPNSPVLNGLAEVEIGVLDLNVFVSHCRFHDGVEFVRAPVSGVTSRMREGALMKWTKDTSAEAAAACGVYAETSTIEHGTHIVGIIDAIQGARFPAGAERNYKIMAYQKPKIDALSDISNINQTIETMQSEEGFTVVNLSIGERVKGGAAGMSPQIKRLEPHARVLFVAASGNLQSNETSHHVVRGETCDVWPACLGTKNVMSVVALDLDAANPKPISQSNTGTAFDIAAPGQSMVSSIGGHRLGCMNGTSQATAVVSGAAALLFASEQGLRPAHVKNRLIYSSDIVPSLEEMVFGGRLNVERAVALAVDQIQTADGAQLNGTIAQWPDTDQPFSRDDGDASAATWTSIRRLRRLGDNLYRVFYLQDGANDKGQLLSEKVRFRKLMYLDEQISISVPPAAGETAASPKRETVLLKEIVDYTGRVRLPPES